MVHSPSHTQPEEPRDEDSTLLNDVIMTPSAMQMAPLSDIPSLLLETEDLASILFHLFVVWSFQRKRTRAIRIFFSSTVDLYIGVLPPFEWSISL